MIEGLRLWAWFQEYLHRNNTKDLVISDCEKCMKATDRQNRQGRGCGYETATPNPSPWQPPLSRLGYKHGRATMCAGYTARLPEVVEVARAHTHWKNNGVALEAFCGGPPTDTLLAYIEILDAEISAMTVWATTSKKDGGGRE